LIAVRVAGLDCGLDASWVREATPWGDLTLVPGSNPSLRGLTNLRGTVLPVLDLAVALRQAPVVPQARSSFLILEPPDDGERGTVGLVVDRILGMVEARQDVEALPAYASPFPSSQIEGVLSAGASSLLVVRLSAVLAAASSEE
jgi:purine-binding chemotaxis protein CheW